MIRFGIPFLLSLMLAFPAAAAERGVIFVDNSAPPNGAGTQQSPLASIADAVASSHPGDIIYVAEGNAPYDTNVALKPGQMLVGSGYGLDAVAAELHIVLPSAPAVQGPGPTIHGSVMLPGDDMVAGVTFANESGAAIATHAPAGQISIRRTFFRPSQLGSAILLDSCTAPVTIEGGGITATAPASGVILSGGTGAVTVSRFPIAGSFTTAVSISNHNSGMIRFVDGATIAVDDAKTAISIANARGRVMFASPIAIATHDGRGIVASASGPVIINGGNSRIAATNGAALDLRDVRFSATFDSVSADGAADGIFIDKLTGKLAVTGDGRAASGGTIRNAREYAISVTQSGGIELASIDAGGAVYLRHVADSKFRDLTVGGAFTGNNLRDDLFDGLHVSGHDVQLQEIAGPITFARSVVTDGGIDVEQKFNTATLTLDHCEVSAPALAGARPPLVRVRASGNGRLRIDITGVQLHDNTGSVISLDASGTSATTLSVLQSFAEKFAGRFIEATSHDQAKLAVAVQQTRVAVPGVTGTPLIVVDGAADTCIDMRDNTLTSGGGAPVIRVHAAGPLSVVGARPADAVLDAPSVIAVAKCGE